MPVITSDIVEVCVFRFKKDQPEFLLLKRSATDSTYPGLWQLVSGSIDDGEKGFEAGLRELKEETGLTPERFWVVPHVSAFYDPGRDAMKLTAFFAAQVKPSSEATLSHEHQMCRWLRYEEARRRLVWPGQRQGLEIVREYIITGEEAGRVTRIILPGSASC